MYAGKTRAEIAGYDDAFMNWVLCRPRDEAGRLIRHNPDLPKFVADNLDSDGHYRIKRPRPYGAMFRQVLEQQGLNESQQRQRWSEWKEANPKFGNYG